MKQWNFLIIALIMLAIAGTGFAAAVSIGTPNGGENWKGTHNIIFDVNGFTGTTLDANIFYDTVANGRTNQIVINSRINDWVTCSGLDFSAGKTCTYPATLPEGTYYITIDVNSEILEPASDTSSATFKVDNTAPVTTETTGNLGTWKTANFTITLSCSDSGSGCSAPGKTQYKIGSGNWTDYSDTIAFSTEGNNTFDYNSIDAAGNIETTHATYAKLDKTRPTAVITSPLVTGTSSSAAGGLTVTFSATDLYSGISLSTIRVDIDGTASTAFTSSNCTASDTNYNCTYTETRFDRNYTDYNITVFASDTAGNAAIPATSIFKYLDAIAPPQTAGLSLSAGNSQVSLSWTASTANDFNNYKVYRSTTSGSGFSEITTRTTNSYTDTGLSNGTTYYYKVSAVDKSGNEGTQSDQASAVPVTSTTPGTPVITSTHDENEWSTDNDPEFTWDAVSNAGEYRCSLDSSSDSTPSSTSGCDMDISYENKSDGTYYFHLRACVIGGNCSAVDHYMIKIDTTVPTKPGNLSAENNDSGEVELTWNSSSDSGSGVAEYRLYRGLASGFDLTETRKIATTDDEGYTDNDYLESKTYYYRVIAIDNAGNQSEIAEKSLLAKGRECKLKLAMAPNSYVKTGAVVVKVNADGKKMYEFSEQSWIFGIKTIDPEIKGDSSGKELSYTIEEKYEGEKLKIVVYTEDSDGNPCSLTKQLTIDGKAPSIMFDSPADKSEVSGATRISAKASDLNSGIAEMNFYYRKGSTEEWSLIGKGDGNGTYTINWGAGSLAAGEYGLKAEAKDNAGNTSESKITVTVKAKEEAVETLGGTLGTEEPLAGEAVYSYEKTDLKLMLAEAGLEENLAGEAEELITKYDPARKMIITGEDGNYGIGIEIKAKNNSDSEANLQIVEIIPKELAESASLVKYEGEYEFTILNNDPIIKFTAYGIAPGQEITINYVIEKGLTKEQADELINTNAVQEFKSPPIIVYGESDLGKSFEGTNTIDALWGTVVVSGTVLIFALLVIAGMLVLRKYLSGEGSGRVPLHTEYKESFLDRVKKSTEGIGRREGEEYEKKKGGKFEWKYGG